MPPPPYGSLLKSHMHLMQYVDQVCIICSSVKVTLCPPMSSVDGVHTCTTPSTHISVDLVIVLQQQSRCHKSHMSHVTSQSHYVVVYNSALRLYNKKPLDLQPPPSPQLVSEMTLRSNTKQNRRQRAQQASDLCLLMGSGKQDSIDLGQRPKENSNEDSEGIPLGLYTTTGCTT